MHEMARLQGELEQVHLDKAAIQAALIEAEASLNSRQEHMAQLSSQLEGLQTALQAEQQAHAEAVAQVYALQTEGVGKAEDQAVLEQMTTQLQAVTRERDDLAQRSEDLVRQLSETRSQQTEAEMRLENWKASSKGELERVRQEMLALSEQLQDLALENTNLRSEREGLIKTISEARRAQGAAEEAIARLEKQMRDMDEELNAEREAEQRTAQQASRSAQETGARLAELESERLILMQTVEAGRRRVQDSERQRDALLPELRALKDDVRRFKELGLEQKFRDSLVRVADAEYQQSLLDAQVRALQAELSEARSLRGAEAGGADAQEPQDESSWEGKCRQLMSKLAQAETEAARKEGQLQQQEQQLEHTRRRMEDAERKAKEWKIRSTQRDKESAWLRQSLREAQGRSQVLSSPGSATADSTMMASDLHSSFGARRQGPPSALSAASAAMAATAAGSPRGAASKWLSKHEQETSLTASQRSATYGAVSPAGASSEVVCQPSASCLDTY